MLIRSLRVASRVLIIIMMAAETESPSADGNKTFACLNCTRRKVKCDKASPRCGSCVKTKLTCVYQDPPPPRRKRKASPSTSTTPNGPREALQTRGGRHLSPDEITGAHPSSSAPRHDPHFWASEPTSGTLVAHPGRSRYITSSHWQHLGDDEVQHLSDHIDHQTPSASAPTMDAADPIDLTPGESTMQPLTAAFMGVRSAVSLLQYHPIYAQAVALCNIFCNQVDPICKLLHIPSIHLLVRTAAQQSAIASQADECLLFAIYHFAVFASTDEECTKTFKQSRAVLRARYASAVRQALANASFLQTTTMSILQALVLFLLAGRDHYDPHTYWIMTGELRALAGMLIPLLTSLFGQALRCVSASAWALTKMAKRWDCHHLK